MLVLCELKLSLRLQTHVLDLSLVGSVLAVDFLDLEVSITLDLFDSLLIIFLDLSDIVSQLLSRVLSCLHVLSELLKLISHSFVVLLDDSVDLALVITSLLLFLCLQLLKVGCIGKHLLRVSLPLKLKFGLALLCKLLDLFLFRVLNVSLVLCNGLKSALLSRALGTKSLLSCVFFLILL